MDDQLGILNKVQEFLTDLCKLWLVRQKLITKTMHFERVLGHAAFRIDVFMERPACWHMPGEFYRANLDNAVAGLGIKTGCFCIKNDLTHQPSSF